MKTIITVLLLTFHVNNIKAQSYKTPPTLIFELIDGEPFVTILSGNDESINGEGVLSEGDILFIRIYREQEYVWLYSKTHEVNLNNTHVQLPLPLNVIPNLKLGGMHYIAINLDTYVYPDSTRELHIIQAKKIFKDF